VAPKTTDPFGVVAGLRRTRHSEGSDAGQGADGLTVRVRSGASTEVVTVASRNGREDITEIGIAR